MEEEIAECMSCRRRIKREVYRIDYYYTYRMEQYGGKVNLHHGYYCWCDNTAHHPHHYINFQLHRDGIRLPGP